MGFVVLNLGTFGALKTSQKRLRFESWGVEGGNFTLVRNGTCMKCGTWD
jgi:hypothetical protein